MIGNEIGDAQLTLVIVININTVSEQFRLGNNLWKVFFTRIELHLARDIRRIIVTMNGYDDVVSGAIFGLNGNGVSQSFANT